MELQVRHWVTGSGAIGGLGHATARVLARRLRDLILTGTDFFSTARREEVVEDLGRSRRRRPPGGCVSVAADLSDVADGAGWRRRPVPWTSWSTTRAS